MPLNPFFKRVFFGPLGLRAGWRLLIFNFVFFLSSGATASLARLIMGSEDPEWTPAVFLVGRTASLLIAFFSIWLMAKIERRSFPSYGLTREHASLGLFAEGSLWGIVSISVVVLFISLFGGYSIRGVSLHGREILLYTAVWALAFLIASLFEEFVFRGYELFTLDSGIRFWPAAVSLSLFFGFVLHFAMKPQETWVDGLSVSLIGLFFCLTVRRTGNLWFAIGWHFAFNFGSLFLYGFPNTGNKGFPLTTRLFDSSVQGPAWLTGGPMGAEASAFVFPMIAILFLAFHLHFRAVKYRSLRNSPKN
jgi:membrane protease YdiL (CAAX protease family)